MLRNKIKHKDDIFKNLLRTNWLFHAIISLNMLSFTTQFQPSISQLPRDHLFIIDRLIADSKIVKEQFHYPQSTLSARIIPKIIHYELHSDDDNITRQLHLDPVIRSIRQRRG